MKDKHLLHPSLRPLLERCLALPMHGRWPDFIAGILVTGRLPTCYDARPNLYNRYSLHPTYDVYRIVQIVHRYEHPWRTKSMKRRLQSFREALDIIEQNEKQVPTP